MRLGHSKLTEIESRLPEGATEEANMVQTSLHHRRGRIVEKEVAGRTYRMIFPAQNASGAASTSNG